MAPSNLKWIDHMTVALDVHPASNDERRQMYRDTYSMWGRKDLTVEEHVAWRMQCPQHNRAAWYVAQVDGQTVASLGAYPLAFRVDGSEIKGIAIGAVHTRPDFRRRGFAPQMLAEVEKREHAKGASLSLLYSDIDPNFYARLGYILCASPEGVLDSTSARATSGGRLVPCDAATSKSELSALYGTTDRSLSISIARDAAYWDFMLKKGAADPFYWVEAARGERVGYVRLGSRGGKVLIRDWGLTSPAVWDALADSVSAFGRERAMNVIGWLPDLPDVRARFAMKPRETEISMIKPLDPALHVNEAVFRDAQQFREIDHV